jgi:cytidylate kinase
MPHLNGNLKKIEKKFNLTPDTAKKLIIETDRKRQTMIDFFYKKKSDNSIFDLVINSSSYKVDEIARIIIHAMELKKIQ